MFKLITNEKGTIPLVVITGGEPMIQNNLVRFINYIYEHGWKRIQIESNGDRLATGYEEDELCKNEVYLIVSPKVVGTSYHKPNKDVAACVDALKFLISADENSPYHSVPDNWLSNRNIDGWGIYL